MKKTLACLLFLGAALPLSAAAGTYTLAQFSGPGIGVIPWGPGGDPVLGQPFGPRHNVVRGIPPHSEVWRVGNITASVRSDGMLSLSADGLLIASGDEIGTNRTNIPFQAVLTCDNAANSYYVSGPATYMAQASGKLVISGKLSAFDQGIPIPLPKVCDKPVLLIWHAGLLQWVAAANPLP